MTGPLLSRARQIADLDMSPLLRLRLLSESLLTVIFRRLDAVRNSRPCWGGGPISSS